MRTSRLKIIGTTLAVVIMLVIWYVWSAVSFSSEVKTAFPEFEEQSTVLYVPWPVGPVWISRVPSGDHPLYSGRHIRGRYTATVFMSDGTVKVTRE